MGKGGRGDDLFVILEGKVDSVNAGRSGLVTLVTLGPKDFFGEMALMDQEPRLPSAVAAQKTKVHRFPSDRI
ncbi:MAG: cyclic nucleotide-binding domain-containing protein [bacterium]|nr:cyclic nucleotide-binding domain-containing protein [bacterium]